jgi:hypothetical protein
MIIQARNTLADNAPLTYLTYSEVAGTSVIRWKNADQMAASWALQLGAVGVDQSEVVVLGITTPAGTAGTLAGATLYEHPADTPIYGIKYDQVVFEVSTVGTTGTAAPISGGTVTVQPNSLYTIYDHTAGSITYAYKTYFKNSVTGSTSQESDWITYAGYSFYSLAKLRERVRGRVYNSDYLKDEDINNYLNEWLQIMNNMMLDTNEDYGLGTTSIAYASNVELGTMTATDFRGGFKRVWWVDASGTYQATKMDSNSFSPTKVFNSTAPYYYMQGDSVIGRKPADNAGTFLVEYNKQTPMLINDTDEIPVPMQSFTKSFVDYGNAMALNKDNKDGTRFEASATNQLQLFRTQLAPRNTSSNTMIDIVEEVGTSDNYGF